MIFSSINQLQFVTTSRRDDLLSLCYLLVFCINEGRLPNIEIYGGGDNYDRFKKILKAKLKHNLTDLCNEESGTADLKEFFQECFSYRYKDQPNYAKLRAILGGLIEPEDQSESGEKNEEAAYLKPDKKANADLFKSDVKEIMADLKTQSQKHDERTAVFGKAARNEMTSGYKSAVAADKNTSIVGS